jgi:hypothetical protein
MRTIKASELGAYIFCQRAWMYQRRGEVPENWESLVAGTEMHYRHGRAVLSTGLLRVAAYLLVLLSLALAAIALISRII